MHLRSLMCALETPWAHNPAILNATNSCTTLKKCQGFAFSFLPLPEFFVRLLAVIFVSTVPTPAVWPKGGTLFSVGGPCLSQASWSALPSLASVRSNEARRGVSGFGSFCRNKRASPAGAIPGNTEHTLRRGTGDKYVVESFVGRYGEAGRRQRLQEAGGTGRGRNSSTTDLTPYPIQVIGRDSGNFFP